MRLLGAVVRRELVTLWTSAIPYVVGAVFHVGFGLLAADTMRARQEAVFQPAVPIAGFLLLLAAPALAMRSLAEERRSGMLDLLGAIPVRAGVLVVGKWLALLASATVVLAPVGVHALLLSWWGEPDAAPMLTGALGLLLLAGAASAVGVVASSVTRSQAVAGFGASALLLVGWFLRPATSSVALRTATARLSLNERLRTFASGGIDLGATTFLVALTVAALLAATGVVAGGQGRRRWRRSVVAATAVAAIVVLALQWSVDDRRRFLDLTQDRVLSLTDQTREVVAALDEDVTITAFLRDDAPGRADAAALLDRYESLDRRIRTRIVDPDGAPGELARLGVDPVAGGVAISADDRIEVVAAPIEQDLTLGLARIVRGELPTVCLTAGHGELDPESTLPNGASRAVGILGDNGYPVVRVDLLAGGSLEECGAVLLLGPVSAFGSSASAIESVLGSSEGRVALFLDSGFDTGLGPLVAEVGLTLLGGTVVEADAASSFAGDPTAPLVRRYSSAHPVVRTLAPTYFVTVGGVAVGEAAPGQVLSRLADSSPASLLVDDVNAADTTARPGPVTVAAASETSANVDGRPVRRRVVVVADSDVVSNAFVTEAANARLLVQVVDWLTVSDDLVSVSSNLARPRPLLLTEAREDYARLVGAVLVPGAFVLAGGFVWAVRRRR